MAVVPLAIPSPIERGMGPTPNGVISIREPLLASVGVEGLDRYLIFLIVQQSPITVSDPLTASMDSGDALDEAILRAYQAALEAKERERLMLLRKMDRLLAVEEVGEKLVAEFLEADAGNKNFDEKAMMDAIVAVAAAMATMVEDLAAFRKKGD